MSLRLPVPACHGDTSFSFSVSLPESLALTLALILAQRQVYADAALQLRAIDSVFERAKPYLDQLEVCLCVCVYMRIYIYTYISIYTNTYV